MYLFRLSLYFKITESKLKLFIISISRLEMVCCENVINTQSFCILIVSIIKSYLKNDHTSNCQNKLE